MTITRNHLCLAYAAAAVLALVGTWGNNVQYLGGGLVDTNVRFWRETLANPASRSITVDIVFLGFAAVLWMFTEARRLAMRGVWLYVLGGIFVAMGAAFPLFLLHRERVLGSRHGAPASGMLTRAELGGGAVLAAASLVYTLLALTR